MNKRTLALAGASVLCAGGVAFAAVASASTGGTGPAAASSSKDSKDARNSKGAKDSKGAFSDAPRVLHSEAVVQDPKTGKLITRDTQSGKVSSVSDTTLTVQSADGTTWVWKLTKDTKFAAEKTARTAKPEKSGKSGKSGKSDDATASDIKSGDEVLVTGARSGDARTARTVSDPPHAFAKGLRKKLKNRFGDDLDPKQLKQFRKDFRRDLRKDLGDAFPHLRDRPGRQGAGSGSSGSAAESSTDSVRS